MEAKIPGSPTGEGPEFFAVGIVEGEELFAEGFEIAGDDFILLEMVLRKARVLR